MSVNLYGYGCTVENKGAFWQFCATMGEGVRLIVVGGTSHLRETFSFTDRAHVLHSHLTPIFEISPNNADVPFWHVCIY